MLPPMTQQNNTAAVHSPHAQLAYLHNKHCALHLTLFDAYTLSAFMPSTPPQTPPRSTAILQPTRKYVITGRSVCCICFQIGKQHTTVACCAQMERHFAYLHINQFHTWDEGQPCVLRVLLCIHLRNILSSAHKALNPFPAITQCAGSCFGAPQFLSPAP